MISLQWRNVVLGAVSSAAMSVGSQANSAVTFYSSAATFAAAEPTAAQVSFASLGATQPYVHANPLALTDVVFSTLNPGVASSALVVFNGSIGNNWFGDTLAVDLGPGTDAVGVDIFNQIGEQGALPQSAPIEEVVYSGVVEIGSTTVTETSGFFGVAATVPITRITFFSDCAEDCSTFANTVSIAGAGATAVPEPLSWTLMGLGFAGLGVLVRSKRAHFPSAPT